MKKLLLLFLATGLMTACTKSEESQQQVEDQPVTGEEISYSTDNLTMNGYLAYDPDTEQAPGILVVHEWWGHNEHARNSAEKLAELGYVALAVDMYGEGKQAEHPDDAGSFASEVMSNFESAQARFTKAMEVLQNHPKVNPEHIGAIGYCFGGSVVISMANAGVEGLDAVAASSPKNRNRLFKTLWMKPAQISNTSPMKGFSTLLPTRPPIQTEQNLNFPLLTMPKPTA